MPHTTDLAILWIIESKGRLSWIPTPVRQQRKTQNLVRKRGFVRHLAVL